MELHNQEIERMLIGEVLVRGSVTPEMRNLSTLDFYASHHSRLWSKILEIDEDGEEINPTEVHQRLAQSGDSFNLTISEITEYARGVPANFRRKDVEDLKNLAIARRLQKLFHGLADRVSDDGDVAATIEEAEAALTTLKRSKDISDGTAKRIGEVFEQDVFPRLDKFVSGEMVKVPFGFPRLDDAINGGVGLGELVVMGAKPKSGKSALVLQVASHQAASDIPALIVSREMANYENGFRFLAQKSRFTNSVFRPHLHPEVAEELKRCGRHYSGLPLFLDDKAKKVSEVRRQARTFKDAVGLKSVFVDYAQLVKPDTRKPNRSDELETIYYDLKEMAHDLELAVYVNVQFNRMGIKSERPTMADFDGSSAAEKAGNLILIWDIQREPSLIDKTRPGSLWIEAGRNVATDSFPIRFDGPKSNFYFEA